MFKYIYSEFINQIIIFYIRCKQQCLSFGDVPRLKPKTVYYIRGVYLYANIDISLPVYGGTVYHTGEKQFLTRSTIGGRDEYRVVQKIM